MQMFYQPNIDSTSIVLTPEESKHCVKVLRMKPGDKAFVTNGKGLLYTCTLTTANIKACVLEVVEENEKESLPYTLHIAIAPTKSMDRMEWFIEKATEIGIHEITPIFCENSERTKINTERLVKKSISAIKQSLSCHLPKINVPIKYKEFIAQNSTGSCFIAHCRGEDRINLQKALPSKGSYTVLIGPEGDFTEKEIEQAVAKEYTSVSLGSQRLRTETAALVACVHINTLHS